MGSPKVFMTPSLKKNAEKILSTPADGSIANKQARAMAVTVLKNWMSATQHLATKYMIAERERIAKLIKSNKQS